MEDRDWLILKVLYDKKNITKAAETLFISQPAITNRLRQMEEEFAVKIVHRGNKGIYFTPQGEFLAKAAEEVLIKIQQIKDNVLNMEEEVTGTLRIGASNFFTKYLLPGILKDFKNHYPAVDFKVATAWSKDIFSLIYRQEVQIGFIRGDHSWGGESQLLFSEPICIASKDEFSTANLPNLPRITYRTDPHIQTIIENWWRERFSQPPLVSMDVDRVDTCKEMVMNGLGYAFLPGLILNDTDHLHKLNITDKEGNAILRRTWMIYQQEIIETNVVPSVCQLYKKL